MRGNYELTDRVPHNSMLDTWGTSISLFCRIQDTCDVHLKDLQKNCQKYLQTWLFFKSCHL